MTGVLIIVAGVLVLVVPLYLLELAAERGDWRKALARLAGTAVVCGVFGGLAVAAVVLVQLGVRQL